MHKKKRTGNENIALHIIPNQNKENSSNRQHTTVLIKTAVIQIPKAIVTVLKGIFFI